MLRCRYVDEFGSRSTGRSDGLQREVSAPGKYIDEAAFSASREVEAKVFVENTRMKVLMVCAMGCARAQPQVRTRTYSRLLCVRASRVVV